MRKRGFAIITVMLVLAMMAVVGLAVTTLGADNLVRLRTDQKNLLAQQAAEAGLWRGVLEVSEHGATGRLFSDERMETVKASYTVTVVQGGPIVINGINVPDHCHYYVESVGTTTGEFYPTRRKVGALLKTAPAGGLDVAIFANTSIVLRDGYTDTWNSAIPGGYTASKDLPANLGNAHIGTNSALSGAVTASDGASVDGGRGNIFVGPSPSPEVVTSGFTGYNNLIPMSQAKALDPIVFPFLSNENQVEVSSYTPLPPGAYGQLQVKSGGVLVLSAGQYQFSEVQFESGGTITLDPSSFIGPEDKVEFYCRSGFQMEAGGGSAIVNALEKPEKLRFYCGGDVEIQDAGSQAYFIVYAPTRDVSLRGGADIYGAVVADRVEVEGEDDDPSAVHFDMALKGLDLFGLGTSGGATGVDVLLFQRF